MKSKNMLEVIFGKSWRTSLMGYGAAIFTAIYPILEKHDFNFHTDWKYLLFAVGFAIFGRTVKDGNVTHSNKETTPQ